MGANISTPVQAGPGAHPTYCTMGTGAHPRVNWPERGVDHTPPSIAEMKSVELHFYYHFGERRKKEKKDGWRLVENIAQEQILY